jgi:hypothetical protein
MRCAAHHRNAVCFFFLSSRTVQSTSEFCCTVVCTQLHCSNVSLHRFTSSGSLSRLLHSTEEKLLGCHARISSAIRLPDSGRFAWCAILGWYRLELFFNYYYLEKKSSIPLHQTVTAQHMRFGIRERARSSLSKLSRARSNNCTDLARSMSPWPWPWPQRQHTYATDKVGACAASACADSVGCY